MSEVLEALAWETTGIDGKAGRVTMGSGAGKVKVCGGGLVLLGCFFLAVM